MLRKVVMFICVFMLCMAAWGLSVGYLDIKAVADTGFTDTPGKTTAAMAITDPAAAKTGVTYSFDEKSGVITISGKGDMPADMRFEDNLKIKKAVVEEGVTSICDYAFSGCSKLKKLSLPDGLIRIGVKSFVNTNIKKLVIPSSVRRIGQCAFFGCKRLKWITMPGDFEFFYEENEPDEWEFRIVSDSGFSGFAAPKKITFTTPLNIKNVEALSSKYLVVSTDDPLYTSIGGAIYSKDGKALVRIPSERTAFRVPEGVEKVYVNAFHYSWYMADEEGQYCCAKLKKLYLPKGRCSITTGKMYEGETLIPDPQALQVIADGTELTGTDMELLTRYCFNPYIEEYKQDPTKWFDTGFGQHVKLLDNGCVITNDGLILRYFGEGGDVKLDSAVTGIGCDAFNYYSVPRQWNADNPGGITSINIPDSVTYIGENAFYDQYSLESLTIPASVRKFGENALSYSGIKKIVFEEGIEEIPQGICANCGSLETVVLPESLKKIGDAAFSNCFSFDIDEYSGFETLPNLTEIGGSTFINCKMKKFVIPEQIKKIGYGAFRLNGDFGRNPEEAEIIVMGDARDYEVGFCAGKAIPKFTQGIGSIRIGINLWTYYTEPNKAGMMMIGCKWQNIGDIDGYEYEAAINEDFSGAARIETMESEYKLFVNVGKSAVKTLYGRVRVFKVNDKGVREYSEWSTVSQDLD